MKKEIVETFRAELKQFDEATRMFYTGQMLRQKYKGISGSFGAMQSGMKNMACCVYA